MDSGRFNREVGGHNSLNTGTDCVKLTFGAGNITLPDTALELRCETAGNIAFQSSKGTWSTWNVSAGERVNLGVKAVADTGSGTDNGMIVHAIY